MDATFVKSQDEGESKMEARALGLDDVEALLGELDAKGITGERPEPAPPPEEVVEAALDVRVTAVSKRVLSLMAEAVAKVDDLRKVMADLGEASAQLGSFKQELEEALAEASLKEE